MTGQVQGPGSPSPAAAAQSAQTQQQQQQQQVAKQGTFAKVIQELMALMQKYLGQIGVNDAGLSAAKWLYTLLQRVQSDIVTLSKITTQPPYTESQLNTAKDLISTLHELANPALEVRALADQYHLTQAQSQALTQYLAKTTQSFIQGTKDVGGGAVADELTLIWQGTAYQPSALVIFFTGYSSVNYPIPWNEAIANMSQQISFVTDQSQLRTTNLQMLMQQFQAMGQGANQVTSKQFKVLELMVSLVTK